MIIGVPKQIKERERRVSVTPAAACQPIRYGHQVLVEKDAGVGAGFSDEAYIKVGEAHGMECHPVTF